MRNNLITKSSITINVSVAKVWDALTNPFVIKHYMFGTETHFSLLSGAADVPENYHTMTYELSGAGGHTEVSLSQDNNSSKENLQHSQQMWDSMLAGLKKLLEN